MHRSCSPCGPPLQPGKPFDKRGSAEGTYLTPPITPRCGAKSNKILVNQNLADSHWSGPQLRERAPLPWGKCDAMAGCFRCCCRATLLFVSIPPAQSLQSFGFWGEGCILCAPLLPFDRPNVPPCSQELERLNDIIRGVISFWFIELLNAVKWRRL